MNIFNEICNYIIKTVQDNAISNGFQYCVYFNDIEKHFNISLCESDIDNIYKLLEASKKVADILIYDSLFDIILYTVFCPDYTNTIQD